jgi:aspartate aminotransferase-like enzyme
MKTRLFTPGPVEIPVRILRALSQVPPHHRTDVFRATMLRVQQALKWLHGTEGEIYLIGASGSGAMEAAVLNFLSPKERALVLVGGKFGERWKSIMEAFGLQHRVIAVDWGTAVDPAAVTRALDEDPSIAAVFATHSETSTGSLHDVEAFAKITRPRGVRLIVDAITSVGVHPLRQDAMGIDVVVCGSQKGLMIPPGIGTVSVAPWAIEWLEGERPPRFYFDLRKLKKGLPTGDTSFTPPVSLVLALEESLAMMREEGLENVWLRHRRLGAAARAGAQALGFGIFSSSPSNAVTALTAPAGVEASAVQKRLRDAHGMVVAGGQDHLKGKIIRVGHMGDYDLADMHAILGALAECVVHLGKAGKDPLGPASKAWDDAAKQPAGAAA